MAISLPMGIHPLEDALPQTFSKLIQTNNILSAEERQTLLDALAEPEITLRSIREQIVHLNERLKALTERERRLAAMMRPYQALLCPFRSLPDDILREIFLFCLPALNNPIISARHAPILLTHISRHTRYVALTTPRLWAAIHITITCSDNLKRRGDAVREWLRRSGVCDLSLSLHEVRRAVSIYPGYGEGVLEAIGRTSSRWKSVSLYCSTLSFGRLFPSLPHASNVPKLASFSLTITDTAQPLPYHVFNNCTLVKAPILRELRLKVSISSVNYRAYKIRWDHLTHLSLGSNAKPVAMGCAGMILQFSPQLRTCALYMKKYERFAPLSLPHLTGISLAFAQDEWHLETPDAMSAFADISLPALERITYDAAHAFMPLIGLVSAAAGRLAHLCVVNLRGPLQLIACLQRCPRLVSLDIRDTGCELPPLADPDLRTWYSFAERFPLKHVGEWLLPALLPQAIVDGWDDVLAPPERLCPKLEYLAIRSTDEAGYAVAIRRFAEVRGSARLMAMHPGYSVLKGLCLDMRMQRSGEDARLARDDFAEQLEAGMRLSLQNRRWDYMPACPAHDGAIDDGRPSWWPYHDELW